MIYTDREIKKKSTRYKYKSFKKIVMQACTWGNY